MSYRSPLAVKLAELDGYKCDLDDAQIAVQSARTRRAELVMRLQKEGALPSLSPEYALAEVEYQRARTVAKQAQGRVTKAKAEVRELRLNS